MGQLDKVAKILKLPTADNAETLIAMIKTELTDKERRKTADIELKKLIEEVSLRIYQIETCVRP